MRKNQCRYLFQWRSQGNFLPYHRYHWIADYSVWMKVLVYTLSSSCQRGVVNRCPLISSGQIHHVHHRKKGRLSGQYSLHYGLAENRSQLRREDLYVLPDRVEVPVSMQLPEVQVVLVHSLSRTLSQNDLSRMKEWKLTSEYVFRCGDQAMTIKNFLYGEGISWVNKWSLRARGREV